MNIDPCEIRLLVRIATQRTGCPLHDEDLEQDATLKAVEAFRKQFEIRYPRALLRKIVGDTVRDHWRRRRPVEDLNVVDEKHFAEPAGLEEQLDLKRRVALLRDGLARLDASKRTILDLFYIEERKVSEIARLQKRSVSAVKMELLRARRLLAGILRNLAERRRPPTSPAANNGAARFRDIIPIHENRASTVADGATGRAEHNESAGDVRQSLPCGSD